MLEEEIEWRKITCDLLQFFGVFKRKIRFKFLFDRRDSKLIVGSDS